MKTVRALTALLALAAAFSPSLASAERFRIFTDPGATHEILSVDRKGRDQRIVVSKRVDRVGETYAKRLIDCQLQTYQILGYGFAEQDLKRELPNPRVEPIVAGAISEEIWRRSCR
ncbi:MAG: hypothetical protein AAFW46_12810 [Pseudomonadota bacterium]